MLTNGIPACARLTKGWALFSWRVVASSWALSLKLIFGRGGYRHTLGVGAVVMVQYHMVSRANCELGSREMVGRAEACPRLPSSHACVSVVISDVGMWQGIGGQL